jgi:hypothetical protein
LQANFCQVFNEASSIRERPSQSLPEPVRLAKACLIFIYCSQQAACTTPTAAKTALFGALCSAATGILEECKDITQGPCLLKESQKESLVNALCEAEHAGILGPVRTHCLINSACFATAMTHESLRVLFDRRDTIECILLAYIDLCQAFFG